MLTVKDLIVAIRKYNEYWFEIKFNGRDYSQEILSQAERIKYELEKLNLDVTDLLFSSDPVLIMYTNDKTLMRFEKINAINWFGTIRNIKDYVV